MNKRKKKLLIAFGGLFFSALLFCCSYLLINARMVVFKRHDLPVANLPQEWQGRSNW